MAISESLRKIAPEVCTGVPIKPLAFFSFLFSPEFRFFTENLHIPCPDRALVLKTYELHAKQNLSILNCLLTKLGVNRDRTGSRKGKHFFILGGFAITHFFLIEFCDLRVKQSATATIRYCLLLSNSTS